MHVCISLRGDEGVNAYISLRGAEEVKQRVRALRACSFTGNGSVD